jgi:PDZ domain-containing secreted protein
MQKIFTRSFSMFFMVLFFSTALLAQETTTPTEEKVIITIRGTDAKGAKITRSMMKTGEDAKNFNVNEYIKENTKDLIDPSITIRDNEDNKESKKEHKNKHFTYNYTYNNDNNFNTHKEKKGFLGVSQKEESYENTEVFNPDNSAGVAVKITRNSGAAKAGLKEGDVLLQLNDAPINKFHDISVFMRTTKPSDKIQVKYLRNGETQVVTATLGQPEDAWSINNEEKEACLGVYTTTRALKGQRGAVIQDFTPVSAAKEVSMQVGDAISAVNGITVNRHQELWDEIAKYKPNQKVRVTYTRDNSEPLLITATLKACKPTEEKIIVVPEIKEETENVNVKPDLSEQRELKLENFSTFPNPVNDMVNISFQGESVPTTLSLYDLSGRVLYQQTLNDFNGDYNQRFDLSAYAKGVVVVRVLQGEKVFAKRIVVN